jgi:GxxExxY protein
MECGCRADLLVDNEVIVGLKLHDAIYPVHEAQILTYLKFAKKDRAAYQL